MRHFIGALGAVVVLAGCATPPAAVAPTDNFITEAGFTKVARGTPTFLAIAHMVPPNRFGHRTTAGTTTYYYFDPTICGCVYTGTAENWAAYKQLAADRMHMDANMFLERFDIPSDTGSG
jgi:hypothetical protein